MMSNKIPTHLYLETAQIKALWQRARINGTSICDEICCAIDAYLFSTAKEELMVLDSATRSIETDIQSMISTLTTTNAHLDTIFTEMERLQRENGSDI